MAGVYIPGMAMPTSCERCPMLDWDLDYIKCKATNRHFKMTECWRAIRVPDCPLIFVPAHGRLIEAERLKVVFHRNVVNGDAFDQLIDIAPTVIPADKEGI